MSKIAPSHAVALQVSIEAYDIVHVVLRQVENITRTLHDVVRAHGSELRGPLVSRLRPIYGRMAVRRVPPWQQLHGAGLFRIRQDEAPRAPHLCDEVARGVPVRLGAYDTRVAALTDDTAGPARVHEVLFTCAEIRFTASTSTPSTRHLLDGVAMSVPHRSKEPAHPKHWLISTQLFTRREKPGLIRLDRGVEELQFFVQYAFSPCPASSPVHAAVTVGYLERQVLGRPSVAREPPRERRAP